MIFLFLLLSAGDNQDLPLWRIIGVSVYTWISRIVIVGALIFWGTACDIKEPEPPEPPVGWIDGYVHDAQTEEPLDSVCIGISRSYPTDSVIHTPYAYTNENGYYACIAGYVNTKVYVSAYKEGYYFKVKSFIIMEDTTTLNFNLQPKGGD